jgi:hypothetical protein
MQVEDDERHATEIRSLIDETIHQILFLEQSQQHLTDALLDVPDDEDFLLAFEENKEVILEKKKRVKRLEESLYQADAAYREERAAEHRQRMAGREREAVRVSEVADSFDDLIPIDDVQSTSPNPNPNPNRGGGSDGNPTSTNSYPNPNPNPTTIPQALINYIDASIANDPDPNPNSNPDPNLEGLYL